MALEPIFFTPEDGQLSLANLAGKVDTFITQIKNDDGGLAFTAHITALESLYKYLQENMYVKLIYAYGGSHYPLEFNQDVLLRKATQDFLMIRRSYLEANADTLRGNEKALQVRELIQAMAIKAFQPAVQPFFKDVFHEVAPKAITYQAHRFEIRIVPYSSVLFIGYPATVPLAEGFPAFEASDEFLDAKYIAVAHEVGHKVFNHGYFEKDGNVLPVERYLRARIKHRLALKGLSIELLEWADSKLEELFADAYGCFVDGPVSILGFQAQMHRSRPAGIIERKHRYLYTPLRPLVQSRMLRAVLGAGDHWAKTALDRLDTLWRGWVSENWQKWLSGQWPELTVGNQIQELSGIDLIFGATYPFGNERKIGYIYLEILDELIDEIKLLFEENRMRLELAEIEMDGVTPETIDNLLRNEFSKQAGISFEAELGRPPNNTTRKPPPGTEAKQVLHAIMQTLDLSQMFAVAESVGPGFSEQVDPAAEAEKFVNNVVADNTTQAKRDSFKAAVLNGNPADSDLQELVQIFVNRHDTGELKGKGNPVNQVLGLIDRSKITPEQIDEIADRQLLRGWSDEGPKVIGDGGFP